MLITFISRKKYSGYLALQEFAKQEDKRTGCTLSGRQIDSGSFLVNNHPTQST